MQSQTPPPSAGKAVTAVTLIGTLSAVAFGVYDRYAGSGPPPAAPAATQSAPARDVPAPVPSTGVLGVDLDPMARDAPVDTVAAPAGTAPARFPTAPAPADMGAYSQQTDPRHAAAPVPDRRTDPGPSFSCALPAERYAAFERAICASPELSRVDRELQRVYAQARRRSAPREAAWLKNQQLDWMRSREQCADDACLMALYEQRIAILAGTN